MKAWLETAMERKQEDLPLLDSVDKQLVCAYAYLNLPKQMEPLLSQPLGEAAQQERRATGERN